MLLITPTCFPLSFITVTATIKTAQRPTVFTSTTTRGIRSSSSTNALTTFTGYYYLTALHGFYYLLFLSIARSNLLKEEKMVGKLNHD